ncbi:MAG: hypothetical protein LBH08_02885 [Puniceicoccales bacterium]|jgi:hypothetical protein|nr:hypothetical protein [Puniceicoccales bacterium]
MPKYFLLILALLSFVRVYGRKNHCRGCASPSAKVEESKNQVIKDVLITTKKNRDFEYLSTMWRLFRGESSRPNCIGNHREQRYVLGVDSEQTFAGTYVVVVLNVSLEKIVGHGELTVWYVVFGELDPRCVIYFLPKKNVADDREIFVRLDPSCQFAKTIVAWKVVIQANDKKYVRSSLFWEKLVQ